MSQGITTLSVKALIKVLTRLAGGNIGFDPYRDERTNKKEKLLSYILQEYSNDEIIAAVDLETAEKPPETATFASHAVKLPSGYTAVGYQVRLRYVDLNSDEKGEKIFFHTHSFAGAKDTAHMWLMQHPAMRLLGIDCLTPEGWDNETPKPAPINKTPEATDDGTNAKLEALKALLAPTVDPKQVEAIMDRRAQAYVDNILEATNLRLAAYDAKIDNLQMPVTVNILKVGETKVVDFGHQHKNFATLVKMAQARTRDSQRLNIWLKGPAGSGKTTAARKAAEALSLPFHFNGAISTEYELMGFKDAAGHYHRTAFREAFENGGVYLFDEVDSSLPKAVLAFNAALANGECRFPDAQVSRHADCVILAGANTAGNGASSDYVGRMKQDLAFLNRFVMLDWPLDEALEKALAANKDWVRKVQKFRANADQRKIKGHLISPRATFYGEALLAVGLSEEIVEQAVLRGALSEEQWATLCQ